MFINPDKILGSGVEAMTSGAPLGVNAGRLNACGFDPGYFRPYEEDDGYRYISVNTGKTRYNKDLKRDEPIFEAVRVGDLMYRGIPVVNATVALRKDEWIQFDRQVVLAARERLRAWGDLMSRGLTYGGFNGMAKLLLEHEVMSDPGEALQNMEGIQEGNTDAPDFQLRGLPLPITYVDFSFSARRIAASREQGMPLDTSVGEAAARRVAEMIEKSVLGTITGLKFGTAANYDIAPQIYGYLTHPHINSKNDMTAPSATNGTTVVDEILELRDLLYTAKHYGPFMVYIGTDYDRYIDNDLKTNSDKTTRQRLTEIDGIAGVRRLDFLSGSDSDTVILVQMSSDVIRAVNGMEMTTMQWESQGGMKTHYRVMSIQVPQIRSDRTGNCGIAVGTTS